MSWLGKGGERVSFLSGKCVYLQHHCDAWFIPAYQARKGKRNNNEKETSNKRHPYHIVLRRRVNRCAGAEIQAYDAPHATKWTVRGRFNIFGAGVEIEGKELGKSFKSKMDADHKKTISIGVNYLGVSVSLSLNPAKMMGKYDDYELNLSLYNNRWGVDVSYQDAHNFKGWHEAEGSPRIDLPPEMLKMKSLNVSAYYAFNRRRFSYPAAFTQSYIQRRSAGSFFLALSGQGQHTETKGDYESVLKVTNIGIGGGYGYNWVPGKNWLLHISALPTFTVFSNTSLKVNGERTPLDYHFPEYIITARGAVIRNFKKMFVGGSMVFHFTNIGDKDKLAVYNNKWLARLFIGIRL